MAEVFGNFNHQRENMEKSPCCCCGDLFWPNPRSKNQCYCREARCQRARKSAWKRHKMQTDPDYRYNHKLSNQKWASRHPGYWKDYRQNKPHQAQRNRVMQRIRNQQRNKTSGCNTDKKLIAKVDALKSNNIKLSGRFWLVPLIAKVDALIIDIYEISTPYR